MYAILFLPTSELLKEKKPDYNGSTLLYSNFEITLRNVTKNIVRVLVDYKRSDYNEVQKELIEYIRFCNSLRSCYNFDTNIKLEFENQCNIDLYEIIEIEA